MSTSARKKIVVVGAGFGGMAAVQALKGVDADITLVDRTNHHLFQPLLYQVATAALSPAEIATATRVLLRGYRNATVLMAEVNGVDPARRSVHLINGIELAYDFLVLATGAAYSFFGHDEWAPYTHVLKTLDDALSIRECLLSAFEWAEESNDPAQVKRLMTFAVIGGGPTGVELAGTMAELARSTLARDFKRIDPRSARIVLCEAGPRLLSAFPPRLSDYSLTALRALGVEVRLGEAVRAIDERGLLVGETRIEAALVLWCAGTEARPAAQWIGADAARNGAVQVSADCSVRVARDLRHRRCRQLQRGPERAPARARPRGEAAGPLRRASCSGRGSREAARRALPLSRLGHHGRHRPLARDCRFRPLPADRLSSPG